jgi:hypothetical protein
VSAKFKFAIAAAVAYAFAWSASYVLVMGAGSGSVDFGHYFEYLGFAWSFSGGELPTFMWFASIAIFAGIAVVAYLVRKVRNRERASAA